MGERVTVEGSVDAVIFQNEENGYTVLLLRVDGEDEPITVVGCIPCAAAGEGMTVTGVWVNHPVHGPQLSAESVELRLPQEEEDIAKAAWVAKSSLPPFLKNTYPSIAEVFHEAKI